MLIIAATDVQLQLRSNEETISRNGFQSDEKTQAKKQEETE